MPQTPSHPSDPSGAGGPSPRQHDRDSKPDLQEAGEPFIKGAADESLEDEIRELASELGDDLDSGATSGYHSKLPAQKDRDKNRGDGQGAAKPTPTPEPEAEAEPEPKAERKTEPEAEAEAEPEPEPGQKREPTGAAPPKREPKPEPGPEPEPEPVRRRGLSAVELISLAAVAAVLVLGVVFLFGLGNRGDAPDLDEPAPVAELPARGELVVVKEIDHYWRTLRDSDRTDKSQDILPEIRVTATAVSSGTPAFVKIHFRDPDGKISGDVRTAKIEGGQFVDTGRGEAIEGAETIRVYGSRGIDDDTAFLAYRYGEDPRWSVEILEGPDYSTGPWTRVAYFRLASDMRGDKNGDGDGGSDGGAGD